MKLLSLEGKNVGRYPNLNIEFKDGVNLIVGDNKHGKSTILDAIQFALYGNCPKAKKISNFKKRGSKGDMVVDLSFMYKNQNWRVVRTYNKSSGAELYIDGTIESSGVDNVKSYMTENFVSEEFLLNSNLASQENMLGLLGQLPSNRFKICNKIFDVTKYKLMAEDIKKDILEMKNNKLKKEGELDSVVLRISEVEQILSDVNIEELEGEEKKISKEVDILRAEVQDLYNRRVLLSKEIENIEEINKQSIDFNNQISSREKELSLKEGGLLEKENTISQIEITGIPYAESMIEEENNIIRKKEEELSLIKVERLPSWDNTQYESLISTKAELSSELKNIQDRISLIDEGKCSKCGNDFTGENKEEYVSKQGNIVSQIRRLASSMGVIEENKKKHDISIQTIQDNADKREIINKVILDHKQRLDKFNNDLATLREKVPQIATEIEVNRRYIEELKSYLNGTPRKELKSAGVLEGDLSKVVEDISGKEANIKSKEDLIRIVKDKISTIKIRKLDLSNLKSSEKLISGEIREISSKMSILEEARSIAEKKLPSYVIIKKLALIKNQINSFCQAVDDQYSIDFEVTSKDTIDIPIYDTIDKEVSDVSNLSGFEKTFISLGIRIGLSHYNTYLNENPIEWVALDEPDKAATEENAMIVYETLDKICSSFKQSIIITHKESVKEMIKDSNIIRVINTGKDSLVEA